MSKTRRRLFRATAKRQTRIVDLQAELATLRAERGELVAVLTRVHRVTQAEIARRLGVHAPAVHAWLQAHDAKR